MLGSHASASVVSEDLYLKSTQVDGCFPLVPGGWARQGSGSGPSRTPTDPTHARLAPVGRVILPELQKALGDATSSAGGSFGNCRPAILVRKDTVGAA